jgi:hypothetical protein
MALFRFVDKIYSAVLFDTEFKYIKTINVLFINEIHIFIINLAEFLLTNACTGSLWLWVFPYIDNVAGVCRFDEVQTNI